jgi:hypothetical protein
MADYMPGLAVTYRSSFSPNTPQTTPLPLPLRHGRSQSELIPKTSTLNGAFAVRQRSQSQQASAVQSYTPVVSSPLAEKHSANEEHLGSHAAVNMPFQTPIPELRKKASKFFGRQSRGSLDIGSPYDAQHVDTAFDTGAFASVQGHQKVPNVPLRLDSLPNFTLAGASGVQEAPPVGEPFEAAKVAWTQLDLLDDSSEASNRSKWAKISKTFKRFSVKPPTAAALDQETLITKGNHARISRNMNKDARDRRRLQKKPSTVRSQASAAQSIQNFHPVIASESQDNPAIPPVVDPQPPTLPGLDFSSAGGNPAMPTPLTAARTTFETALFEEDDSVADPPTTNVAGTANDVLHATTTDLTHVAPVANPPKAAVPSTATTPTAFNAAITAPDTAANTTPSQDLFNFCVRPSPSLNLQNYIVTTNSTPPGRSPRNLRPSLPRHSALHPDQSHNRRRHDPPPIPLPRRLRIRTSTSSEEPFALSRPLSRGRTHCGEEVV